MKSVAGRGNGSYQQRKPEEEEQQLGPVPLFCATVVGWGWGVSRFKGKMWRLRMGLVSNSVSVKDYISRDHILAAKC